ncbi:hypothetical protein CYMTET_51641 [Cymbomonas tetramitiformis]|uniref:Uncharacterized protein n=1 Tax=Cymbomonas tetramitiformis TaxID=36881 RepID=A0AAE0BM30_9CHLO|nr:hypothetical protein CYMTET_51641 [Cymbomonas tetramitiformis]
MAIGDTDNVQSISTTLQELQEVEAACCQGTYAELQELLYVIPVACETMDLLECYDINRLHVQIFHESYCEGIVVGGLGHIGIGLLFLALAFSLLLKLSSRLVYEYGMYAEVGWTLSCCESGSEAQEWPERTLPAGNPHCVVENGAFDTDGCTKSSK